MKDDSPKDNAKLGKKAVPVMKTRAQLLRRMAFVPEGVAKSRIAICENCEFYYKPANLCKKCKCIMPAKTKLTASECPEKKWGKFILPVRVKG